MKWNIGTKIAAAFSLILLILVIIGVLSYRSTEALIETSRLREQAYGVIVRLENIHSLVKDAELAKRGYLISADPAYLAPFELAEKKLPQELAALEGGLGRDSWRQEKFKTLKELVSREISEIRGMIRLRSDNAAGLAAASREFAAQKGREAADEIRAVVDQLQQGEQKLLEEREESARDSAEKTVYTIGFGTLFSFLALFTIGLVLTRNIAGPLQSISEVASRLTRGDLRTEVPEDSRGDEVGNLNRAFREMVFSMRDVASQTRLATENLNAASAQIMASTKQQAASTSEQSAAVQETTATVEEISQTGSQISDKAKKIASAAAAASAASSSGIKAVQNTNQTMQAIQEQAEAVAENIVALSEKNQAVGEIITSVNDIAERSNLLALNASIEAAAAGEQGRSFAVVAHEIKNLADQAKQATVQVRSILGEIQNGINTSVMLTEEAVKRVESGRKQADVAEQTIVQMSGGIQESVQAFQQIVAATNQQQIGLEQVTQAMKDIKTASEQTAIGTNQLEQATLNINALGQQLRKSVERYKI